MAAQYATGFYVVKQVGRNRGGAREDTLPYVEIGDNEVYSDWPDWAYDIALAALLANKRIYVAFGDKDAQGKAWVNQVLAVSQSAG